MKNTVVWVVGEPGAGKTTLVSSLIDNKRNIIPKPKWTVGSRTAAAGHYVGGKFDGADTIPYNGVTAVLEFWREVLSDRKLTVLDGDRLSNFGVVDWFRAQPGVLEPRRMCCIHLAVPAEVGAARRKARGSDQSEIWVRGRITKSNRFAGRFEDMRALDATEPREVLVTKAKEFLRLDWELLEEDPD